MIISSFRLGRSICKKDKTMKNRRIPDFSADWWDSWARTKRAISTLWNDSPVQTCGPPSSLTTEEGEEPMWFNWCSLFGISWDSTDVDEKNNKSNAHRKDDADDPWGVILINSIRRLPICKDSPCESFRARSVSLIFVCHLPLEMMMMMGTFRDADVSIRWEESCVASNEKKRLPSEKMFLFSRQSLEFVESARTINSHRWRIPLQWTSDKGNCW